MRRKPALVLAVVAALVAACAGVPSGGRVIRGNAGGPEQPLDDPYVRIIPVGPERGWDPVTMVTGFRNASASFDGSNGEHQVAREYLACGGCWRPGVQSIVYDQLDPLTEDDGGDRATVTVTGTQLGHIGSDGQYTADANRFRATYGLRRYGAGQWRITSSPQELLLSRDDVDRAFRTLNLYFYAPEAQVLVPNPVYIPLVSRPWLSRQLVRQLLGGPTTWLKGAGVRTAFPQGTRLRRLDITGGVATVDLTGGARAGDVRDMSIQLMWTLRQLREVKQLRLEIDGRSVRAPGADAVVQSTSDWAAYDPDGVGVGGEPPVYVRTADGRLARLAGFGPQPVAPKLRVNRPAISYDDHWVAYLGDDSREVSVAELTGAAPRAVLAAAGKDARFDTPSWDTRGNVWVVESSPKGSRLWVIEDGSRPMAVGGWSLSQYPVSALRVSRDGTRAAAIVHTGGVSQIQLGRVDRAPSGGLQAEGFVAINSQLQSAFDLAWNNSDHLAVVGVAPGNPSPLLYDVPVSGTPIQPMFGPGGDMNAVAASPRAPLYVAQHVSGARSPHSVCRLSDRFGEWNCWPGTSEPAFPG